MRHTGTVLRFAEPGTGDSLNLHDWVKDQVGSEEATGEVLTFVRRWSDLQRERPDGTLSLGDFEQRWNVARHDAVRSLGLFRVAFPGQATPSGLLKAIAQDLGGQPTPFEAWVRAADGR